MVFTNYTAVPSFIANPTGGSTPQPSYAGSPYGSQPYTGETGQAGDPGYERTEAARWDQYVASIQQAMQASAGWTREQYRLQLADAQKGRDLQWKIAQLQDSGADNRLVLQLKEQARQYDLNHNLEMEKLGFSREQFGFEQEMGRADLGLRRDEFGFTQEMGRADIGLRQQDLGLRRAQTAAEYMATPDRYITGSRFLNLSGRVLAGQNGVTPYGQTGTPAPKTEQDFAVLQQGGAPGRQLDPTAAAQAGGAGGDRRAAVLNAAIKAFPPSEGEGLDTDDYAVLNIAKAIYASNLRPGQQASINADARSKGVLFDAGKNLGYDPDAWWQSQRQSLPGQGNVRQIA